MNLDQLSRALFWTIPFAASVVLSLSLLYISRKDRDKKKIMLRIPIEQGYEQNEAVIVNLPKTELEAKASQ